MHDNLNHQLTPRQSQVAISAAMADIDNDQTDDIITNQPTRIVKKKPPSNINYAERLLVHYTHEKRFRPFKKDMHTIYDRVFKNTTVLDLQLIIGNRNRRDAKNELIRKRPKPSLLQNQLQTPKRIKTKYKKLRGKL